MSTPKIKGSIGGKSGTKYITSKAIETAPIGNNQRYLSFSFKPLMPVNQCPIKIPKTKGRV